MRFSLLLKLLGAFFIVLAISTLVISLLLGQYTQNEFTNFSNRTGQAWAVRLAPVLAQYYLSNGSWDGVDGFLNNGLIASTGMGIMMSNQGNGRPAVGPPDNGMWEGMNQHIILADTNGKIVYDSQDQSVGTPMTDAQKAESTSIRIVINDPVVIGMLLVTPSGLGNQNSPAGAFLMNIGKSLFITLAIASLIALGLGALLFRQITQPVRKLSQAAGAIAAGDLKTRVELKSRDELGDLGGAFNQMAESLERSETQRRHMIADVAHELRTPLTVIQGGLEGMQDGVLPTDASQLGSLHEQTMLLNRLINDLALLATAEAGHLELMRVDIEPGKLIRRVVEHMQVNAQQKGVALTAQVPDGLPLVNLDPDRIHQVLLNLINNSIHYTPSNGSIVVSVEPEGQGIAISVTDNGTGIDEKDLPYVFDRFYRGDSSRTRSSGGSGLGLAIVKQLVEAHGGRVEVQSPVSSEGGTAQGTRMTIHL